MEVPEPRKAAKRKESVTETLILKGNEAFKQRYSQNKGPRKDTRKLVNVKHQDTECDYLCRILNRADAPCQDPELIAQHFRTLNGLEHPHICKFVEAFQDDARWYLVYEKADITTLFKFIQEGQSFAEEDAAEYTRQMCMALAVAHEQGIYHGRLSPTKVVIMPEDRDSDEEDEDAPPAQVKICDMGQGFILRENGLQQLRKHKGTPDEPKQELVECIPPELVWGEIPEAGESAAFANQLQAVDVWGVGCITYHMLTGVPPHCSPTVDALVERVKTQGVEFGEEWAELSADARDATECMLKVNTGLRLTCSALLRHPWLRLPRARLPKVRLLRLLRNIRENASQGHFKRMVMRVIAQQLPAESRLVTNIEQAFRFFDRNGDGVLGVPEICQCIRKLDLGIEADMGDLEETIELLDRDGSSTVNLQEFVAGALNPRCGASLHKLWGAFNAFDRDVSGSVSVDEIEAIVRVVEAGLLGKEQVDGLVDCIRQELEVGGAGQRDIDFDQFVYIMTTSSVEKGSSAGSTSGSMRRDFFRGAFNLLGVDCYDVRRYKPQEWNWQQMSQSPPSAYRRKNLVMLRRETHDTLTGPGNVSLQEGDRASPQSPVNKTSSSGRRQRGKQPGQPGKR